MDSEQHHYCMNLVEVNKQRQVLTTQEIYNQQGVLLLAKGAPIDEQRSRILLQHKLLKPLEACVGIADSLDARQLFAYLNKFAQTVPGLYAVTTDTGYQHALRQVCLFYERFPLLQQNLTVLALRAKHIYFNGIFCAMAGLAIARQLDLSIRELQTVFVAGLFHDVGFLYLAPNLIHKSQDFTAEEWRALQAHPLIAQRFLDMVPQLPNDVGAAIAGHHERIDGTGYPRHLFGDELSMVSQIIAATDNMIFNHNRYRHYGPHAHKMLLIALRLSDNIYFDAVYDAATVLFKVAPAPQEKIRETPSAGELLQRQQSLRAHFDHVRSLSAQINLISSDILVRSINAVMGRLAIAVVRSGVLQTEQEDWLNKLSDGGINDANLADESFSLLEISVMQDQILDQLIHVKNLMDRFIEKLTGSEPDVDALIARVNALNLQSMAA